MSKIIITVLIVSSLHILKCYQDASPVIKYSYEIKKYERFDISLGTLLLVDFNALISVLWEFFDNYLQMRCFKRSEKEGEKSIELMEENEDEKMEQYELGQWKK